MNRFELERILTMIEANVQTNQPRLRHEILNYIQDHEDDVLKQLRSAEQVTIPTSLGSICLSLSDLREAVA